MDLQAIRREYLKGGLHRKDLPANPLELFARWMQDAIDLSLPDANAMTVASVGNDGQPSQRIVLLKSVDDNGFVFFTNYESRKARELDANPRVSLHFPWHVIERQVEVSGLVEKVGPAESQHYFTSRPRESQLAAWASAQSRPLASKDELMKKYDDISRRYDHGDIPLPEFWGGYRVRPRQIEFWQGGKHRLHDRFEYTLQSDTGWTIERLAP